MVITEKVVSKIFENIGDVPPEIGGIIGASDLCIDYVAVDIGFTGVKACSYMPNVKFLNDVIKEWQEEGVEFKGIFHSHYFGIKTLSDGDKKYIRLIMRSMPVEIESLYFPIAVMPERELVVYKAYRYKEKVKIESEKLIICEGEGIYEG